MLALQLNLKLHEIDSQEYINHITDIIEGLNKRAMKFVQQKDTQTGVVILTKCEEFLKSGQYGVFPLLRNLTYNNFGCIYRRIGQVSQALHFLKIALKMLVKANKIEYSSITYLNLCAVLSQTGE